MAIPRPFMSGKDSRMRLFMPGGKEIILNAKSWNIDIDVTEAADGVNGEDRDRLDSFINFFKFSAACFKDGTAVLDAWLEYYANQDAQVAPLEMIAGVNFQIRDGSKGVYVAQEVNLGTLGVNNPERKERLLANVSFRCRYFSKAPSL